MLTTVWRQGRPSDAGRPRALTRVVPQELQGTQGVAAALREARGAADAKVSNLEKALKRSKDAEDALCKDLASVRMEVDSLKQALKVP